MIRYSKLWVKQALGGTLILALAGCASSGGGSSDGEKAQKTDAGLAPEGSGDIFGVEDSKGSMSDVPAATSNTGKQSEGGYKTLSQSVRSGNVKGVTEETSRILSANPNDPVALNALALMYVRRSKPGAAKLVLNRALEKNSGVAALYNNLGVILLEENDVPAAIVQFKKALKADSNHVEANGNLGAIYASGGDYNRARPLLEVAYRANRGNVAVANNYAVALRVGQDLEGAKRIYEDLLKKDSRDISALMNYAILLIDFMNKPKEGLDVVYKIQFLDSERKDVQAKLIALEKKAKAEVK